MRLGPDNQAPELLPGGAGRDVPAELSDVYRYGVIRTTLVSGTRGAPVVATPMLETSLVPDMEKWETRIIKEVLRVFCVF